MGTQLKEYILTESKIIILSQIIETRETAKELAFYQESLGRLSSRLDTIRREIQLTQTIIRMIKTEQIIRIKR